MLMLGSTSVSSAQNSKKAEKTPLIDEKCAADNKKTLPKLCGVIEDAKKKAECEQDFKMYPVEYVRMDKDNKAKKNEGCSQGLNIEKNFGMQCVTEKDCQENGIGVATSKPLALALSKTGAKRCDNRKSDSFQVFCRKKIEKCSGGGSDKTCPQKDGKTGGTESKKDKKGFEKVDPSLQAAKDAAFGNDLAKEMSMSWYPCKQDQGKNCYGGYGKKYGDNMLREGDVALSYQALTKLGLKESDINNRNYEVLLQYGNNEPRWACLCDVQGANGGKDVDIFVDKTAGANEGSFARSLGFTNWKRGGVGVVRVLDVRRVR
jgi:hypothetical protein